MHLIIDLRVYGEGVDGSFKAVQGAFLLVV